MYIARTTLTDGPTLTGVAIARLIAELRTSFAAAGVALEHVTVLPEAGRITVTLYVQAASQSEADTIARLAGARLCTELPGWTLDASLLTEDAP
jgi:hypothetical protein